MGEPPLPAFDPLVHSPARLKVLLLLAARGTIVFARLADESGLTSGNLASHLKQLAAAGYVEPLPGFIELKPRLRYRLTERGRRALVDYRLVLESAIRAIEESAPEPGEPA